MQQESVMADLIKPDLKKLSDEKQFAVKLADAVKGIYEMKWMNLSHFCDHCERKMVQDIKYRNKYFPMPKAGET